MMKTLILDVGGVLAFDVWEHLLLDKNEGIASTYNLDEQKTIQAGSVLWEQFAYQSSSDWRQLEIDYWTQFNNLLGSTIPIGEILQLTDKFIKPVEGMAGLLEALVSQNIDLAICSNNTEFWFERQSQKLGLAKYVSPERIILSCRIGASKSSSLFEMFEKAVSSLGVSKSECVFIDDRVESISRAIEYGLPSILFPSQAQYGSQYLRLLLLAMKILNAEQRS
jgi:FMN phosphatase YigB (HAD superfamily)